VSKNKDEIKAAYGIIIKGLFGGIPEETK